MPWPSFTLFGRLEVKCLGARAEGDGNVRARVGMTGWGDAKAGEPGQRVGAGSAVPQADISPSTRCDVKARVMGCARVEVKSGVS